MELKKKILVIDDDDLVRESIKKILIKANYEPVLAENADAAIKIALKEKFAVVVSDIRMPGKNGVEAVRELRSIFNATIGKDVPVIFITGFANLPDELNAEKLGEVILKPFDLDRLLITIREYL